MRSKKRAGIVLAAGGVVALLLAALAAGAVTTSAAAPVGSGKASPTKSVCGLGTGKKARGKPINIGAIVTVVRRRQLGRDHRQRPARTSTA